MEINNKSEIMETLLIEQEKYRKNLPLCIEASEILKRKLQMITEEHKKQGLKVVYTTDRIKSENSYLGKVVKKMNDKVPLSYEKVHDIVGFRVICLNKEDADKYKNFILNSKLIKVIDKKDYITNPKNSGYRSYHLIVEIPVETMEGVVPIKAEIQIRTILMDIFAREEHKLNYKADCSAESQKILLNLSRTLNFYEDSFDRIIDRKKVVEQDASEECKEEFDKVSYLYDSAKSMLAGKLNSLLNEYPDKDDIAYSVDRIKPVSSISRKLQSKKLDVTSDNIRTQIGDVVGFKIVCLNKNDVKKLVEYFKESKAFDIRCEKDYITEEKDSGYMGYHLKVAEEVPGKNGNVPIISEIQIRTMLMDAWALHDDILYGRKTKTPAEKEKLAELSAALQVVSSHLQYIKDTEYNNEVSSPVNYVKMVDNYKNSKYPNKGALKFTNK